MSWERRKIRQCYTWMTTFQELLMTLNSGTRRRHLLSTGTTRVARIQPQKIKVTMNCPTHRTCLIPKAQTWNIDGTKMTSTVTRVHDRIPMHLKSLFTRVGTPHRLTHEACNCHPHCLWIITHFSYFFLYVVLYCVLTEDGCCTDRILMSFS